MKKIFFAGAAVLLLAAGCSSQTASDTRVDTSNVPSQSQDSGAQGTVSASQSSNASLDASLGGIDAELESLNSESAGIDSSLNEQQTP